ncbi:TonB-dependent receptor [Cecembia calidifontis]|uniref:Hemoglobin/transferrin/lactoferrin receptor protein n=1 Tax=Cecembia calidifontis TaxID=1187080 RepID=A0A4Q7P9L1_9BACT|nr:TonB-dependent receptor [Cecembia calidifontis]RZS96210.1 hemoglobin/transferrin/lactoferrin receptor protein [Cecembia calidifontis]
MRIAFFLCFFLISTHSFSQTLVIRDWETKKPLEFVTVTDMGGKIQAISNENGEVDLSDFSKIEKLEIRLFGYRSQTKTYSQIQEENFRLFLYPSVVNLQQAVVSATKWEQNRQEIPSKISTITKANRELLNPQTAADLLGISGDVFIQKSQQGGGSPMIRGFSTNRLLYSVDGVRMNTAIFRSGNLHNVISLDPFAIESTEVFFGPGSIVYGSDAIGAVMSFQTIKPELVDTGDKKIQGSLTLRGNTANNEKTGHLHLKYGGKKWAGVSSFTRYDFGDLRMGSKGPEEFLRPVFVVRTDGTDKVEPNPKPLIQVPTGYQQTNLMQKLRYSPNEQWDVQYAFHYSETSDFPRYDRLIRFRPNGLPRSAEWFYGPQIWMMNHLKISQQGKSKIYDQMTLSLSQQRFEESRIDRNFNDPIRRTRIEKVDAFAANLDFLKEWTEKKETKLFYGAEIVTNKVNSSGTDKNILTGNINRAASRYPNANWSSQALYANFQQRISSKSLIQSGIRYNRFSLDADFSQNLEFYPLPFSRSKNQEGALNASLGWVYTPQESWIFHVNASTGFRAPNVDDIGKVFDSEPGTVMVPNPNLKAEYAYNLEVNAGKILSESVMLDFTTYYTRLDNALVRRKATLNGMDSIIYDGELSRVLSLKNAAFVEIIGLQAALEIKFDTHWSFSSKLNIQKGTEETDDGTRSPSRHAPPIFGVSRLEYKNAKLRIQLFSEYAGSFSFEQLPLEERGKPELYAIDQNGNPFSPSWATINLMAKYQLHKLFTVSSGLENITDVRYRTYSSGVAAPGRNFILSLTANF